MQEVDIGSYNGVMLRNRLSMCSGITMEKKPANLTSPEITAKMDLNSNEESFICGTVPNPWGSNVVIAEKSRVLSRISKNDGALSRHKKWLRDMQEKQGKELKEREEEARVKEKKKREFMEKQARRRLKAREKEDCLEEENICDTAEYIDDSSVNMTGEKRSRPAWALTETLSRDVQNLKEEEEERDLMEFVDDLQVETFYDDMELRVLMSQIKSRIRTLEKEQHVDNSLLRAVMDVSTQRELWILWYHSCILFYTPILLSLFLCVIANTYDVERNSCSSK